MLTPIRFLLIATIATAAYRADACFLPAKVTTEVTISAIVPIPGCGPDDSWEEHPLSGDDVQDPAVVAADGAGACFDPSEALVLAQATTAEAEEVDACFPPAEVTAELPVTISANSPIPDCGLDASWEEHPFSRGNWQNLRPAATASSPTAVEPLFAASGQPSSAFNDLCWQ
jgi:hypothetical protein